MSKKRVTFLAEPEVNQGIDSYIALARAGGRKMNMSRAINEILANHFGIQDLFVKIANEHNRPDVIDNSDQSERNQRMMEMRNSELMTLQEIADVYDISRERVRQIVGNSDYKSAKTKRLKKVIRKASDKTNNELAKKLGISTATVMKYRDGQRHAIEPNSYLAEGIFWEGWLQRRLEPMGADVEMMPHGHPYDMIVNGKKVDVKYCNERPPPPSMDGKIKSQRWCFGINYKAEDCDLFVCITAHEDVFIIPSSEVGNKQQLVFCYPTLRPTLGKYQKYLDRYDLLGIS